MISHIDKKNKRGILDQVLIGNPKDRGNGYGTQMVKRVLQIGFTKLRLHSMSLSVPIFNTSAIKCYEKAGFIQDGTMRDAVLVNDTYWSYLLMSILDSEWHAHQRSHENHRSF